MYYIEKMKDQTKEPEIPIMVIDSKNVFNQMVKNIKIDKEENNIVKTENINAKDLTKYDGINVINDDEYVNHILCLITILSKEIGM